MKLRIVFWNVLQCKIIVDRRFGGTCCLHHHDHPIISSLIMEAARTSETSVDNYFTRQHILEDNSEFRTGSQQQVLNRTVTDSVFIINDCYSGALLYSFRHRRASAFRGTQFEQLMRKRLNEKHCEATSRDWRKRACHVQIRWDQILQLAEQCHAISWLGDQHACASGTELPR
jgi:hypothetical protein